MEIIRFRRTQGGYTVEVGTRPVGRIYYGDTPPDGTDPRLRQSWNLELPARGVHRGYAYQVEARRDARRLYGD